MSKKIKSILKYVLFLGLSITLLFYALKDISLEKFVTDLGRTDYRWLLLSLSIAIFSHLARAYRWIILLEPIGYKPKLSNTFFSVMIGYLANLAFPRAGEVSRCAMLKKTDNISVDASFGTVITERIFDLIMLIILIFVNVLIESKLKAFLWDEFGEKINMIINNSVMILIIVSLLLSVVVLFFVFRNKIKRSPIYIKVSTLVSGLLSGLFSFSKIKRKGGFILSTVVIWICYWLMIQVAVFAYPETAHFGFIETFTLTIVGGLAMSAPVQGGIGAYHLLVGSLLMIYGLSLEDGRTAATILHSSQMLMMIVVGSISIIAVLIKESNLKKITNADSQ